jgi:DNA-binding NtrC family response regulator
MTSTVLIIDDMPDVRLSAQFLLSNHGYQTIEAESPQQGFELLKQHAVDLILLDMNYAMDTTSGKEGLEFLTRLRGDGILVPVIAMTAWASIDLAVLAMQKGAGDFIGKPWDNQRLLQIVKQQMKLSSLQRQNQNLRQHNVELQQEQLIWQSRPMVKLLAEIERLATTDATILLTGENGTGKSSIAKCIHQWSARSTNSFVTVNMGAIPSSLFESEMFGHKKGAFTDAKESRIGRFEMATGGTLFLDEIGSIPLPQQAKLLRVLESSEYEMVGSSITQKADVRLISASNADFEQLLSKGEFRPDLFYRLNTIELRVPALRERLEDIMPLARHFVTNHCIRYGHSEIKIEDDVEDKLRRYGWPGNIRELSHVMERAVLLCSDKVIRACDLQLRSLPEQAFEMPLMKLDQAEQQLLKMALSQANGSVIDASELLGISSSAIYRRLEKYGIKA